MVGGTAALPQARGMDGGEPEDEEEEEVYVGHRKTKRRKHGHGDKVRGQTGWLHACQSVAFMQCAHRCHHFVFPGHWECCNAGSLLAHPRALLGLLPVWY